MKRIAFVAASAVVLLWVLAWYLGREWRDEEWMDDPHLDAYSDLWLETPTYRV